MSELTQDVSALKGVGEALSGKLGRLGVASIADLLFHLPLRYQDRTRVTPIGTLRAGMEGVVEGEVAAADVVKGRRRSLLVRLKDGSGIISLLGHFCLPLAPWGITWAYLGIVYFFNELPALKPETNDTDYLQESWFTDFRTRYWNRYESSGKRLVRHYVPREPVEGAHRALPANRFTALQFGPISVPLR